MTVELVTIEFGELPPDGRRDNGNAGKHEQIAKQLRARPHEWARILRNVNPESCRAIKTGRSAAYRPVGAYEAVLRRNPEHSKYDVWARYVGEQP
jgi:hypothetical protein